VRKADDCTRAIRHGNIFLSTNWSETMRGVLLWLLLSLTTGCASLSNSPTYHEAAITRSADAAVVTVFRTGESPLYLLRSAPVYVNGASKVSLPTGSFHAYVLNPGRYRFVTKTFDANSECVLDVDLHQGVDYFIEVAPNSAAVQQLLTDSFIWLAEVSITERITSLSVGDYNQLCEGMFAFIPTRGEIALQKLSGLRQVD
jgi:hypothetical protein